MGEITSQYAARGTSNLGQVFMGSYERSLDQMADAFRIDLVTLKEQVNPKDSQRILESDELENRLFKESYNCRVFRVKDTIRGIGICLESESFAKSKLYFDSEISRVRQ